ncbi:DUF3592 domain-containing protein [Streptomyces sp. NPDC001834]|uniref:DUF3592 domain-containing protein n=1 Tax=Streptomyces sp. NPDC001834 TaxID=3364616 RepID=UPI00367EE2B8
MVISVVYFVVALGAAVAFGRALDRQLHGPGLRAAWADGLTAEARCTRVRTEERQDADAVPFVHTLPTLEFRTADGRTVAFEERRGRVELAEGDVLTVYYNARDPQAATTRAPSFGMLHLRALVTGAGAVLAAVTATVLALVL